MRVKTASKESLLQQADFVTVHVPAQADGTPAIGKAEFDLMHDSAALVHCARGGVFGDDALVDALDIGNPSFAWLGVLVGEPTPSNKSFKHAALSLPLHSGPATKSSQP